WVTLLSSGTVPPNFPKEQREDLENLLQARTSAFSWLSLVLAHFFIKAVGKRKHGVEHQTKKGWHEKLDEQSWDVHLTKVYVVSVIHVGAVCRGGFCGLS
ncbi:MAG: hypothetical protein ACFNTC_08355, partial [Prevotella sp.]